MLPLASLIFPMTDRVFAPNTSTQEVYEVAGRPVVKAAMEGVNGMPDLLAHDFFPCA